jgi:hypothetical protein
MPSRSLGFDVGDILLVPWEGKQRMMEVKRILPNLDVTYGNLLRPGEREDKHIQFYSGDGFEILHRPKGPCYEPCLKLPAERLAFAHRGGLGTKGVSYGSNGGYVEVLKFEEEPEGHSQYVVHAHAAHFYGQGRCWECVGPIDALTIFNEVVNWGDVPSSTDEWFCSGMK